MMDTSNSELTEFDKRQYLLSPSPSPKGAGNMKGRKPRFAFGSLAPLGVRVRERGRLFGCRSQVKQVVPTPGELIESAAC